MNFLSLLAAFHLLNPVLAMGLARGGLPVVVGGGTPDLVNEDFEGVGTPAGWITSGTGSANFDSTVGPLAGNESLLLDDTAGSISAIVTFALKDELWGHFLFRPTTIPASFSTFFKVQDDVGFIDHMYLQLLSTGLVALNTPTGLQQSTVAAMSAATTYDVWWHWKKGTGSNSVVDVWFNTGGTRSGVPANNHATITTGSDTAQADRCFALLDTSVIVARYDTFQVSSTDVF